MKRDSTGGEKNPDELLSLETVEVDYHVTRAAQYYKRRQDLPTHDPTWPKPIRIGRRKLRYRRSELERWIEDNRVGAVTAGDDA